MARASQYFLYDEMLSEIDIGNAGDNFSLYMRDVLKLSTLDEEQLKSIYIRIDAEPERKQELINNVVEANLRLVLYFAKRYVNRGLEYLDFVQFGNIGLVLAAWKYDYRQGTRFSTLASHWIVHEIERSISLYARPVRLPENVLLEQLQITKTENSLRKELGREPQPSEVALRLGVPEERILRMKKLKEDPVSLDDTLVDDGNMTLGDTIAGNENVAEQVISGINAAKIREILEALPDKERYILESRFGEKGSTLSAIGNEFNITREAVRQKQENAIINFKKAMVRKKLTVDDLIS